MATLANAGMMLPAILAYRREHPDVDLKQAKAEVEAFAKTIRTAA